MLLTDVVMPGASGPELTRRLVDRRPELKVIYMSVYTEAATFTSETLGRKIRDVLDATASGSLGRQ